MDHYLAKRKFAFPRSDKFFLHKLCDYIEMKIFLYGDGISIEDILGSTQEPEKKLLREFYKEEKRTDALIYEEEDDEEEDDDDDDDDEIGSVEPELDDEELYTLSSVFAQLKQRADMVGDPYPFEFVDANYIQLKINIKSTHKQYLMLLICAYHNLFTKSESYTITTEFERMAYCALVKYFPTYTEIFELGKNTQLPAQAIPKLILLSKKMGIEICHKKLRGISSRNVNEEGTDIIAWLPFQDSNQNKLVFLFQATCQKHWFHKQFEVERYKRLFAFTPNPIQGLIVPHLFNEGEEFCRALDVGEQTLLFDRSRLVELLKRKRVCTKKLKVYKSVQNILNDL